MPSRKQPSGENTAPAKKTRKRQTPIAPRLERVIEVYKLRKDDLMQYENVVDVGYGLKRRRGKYNFQKGRRDAYCIVVVVKTKKPLKELGKEAILPKSVNGVPIDVIEAREQPPKVKLAMSKLQGGTGIRVTAGGKVVTGTVCVPALRQGVQFGLTCSHVAFGKKAPQATSGTVEQAGQHIGDCEKNGLHSDPPIDVATFKLNSSVLGLAWKVFDRLGITRIWERADNFVGKVFKVGDVTNKTRGVITFANSGGLPVPVPDLGLTYKNCIKIEPTPKNDPFALEGDSGALVVHEHSPSMRIAIGILFGIGTKPEDLGCGFAQPIKAALSAVNIDHP